MVTIKKKFLEIEGDRETLIESPAFLFSHFSGKYLGLFTLDRSYLKSGISVFLNSFEGFLVAHGCAILNRDDHGKPLHREIIRRIASKIVFFVV